MRLLINKSVILKYRRLSNSVTDEEINRYIADAQQFDLRNAMGRTNYNELFTDDTKLNNGTDYLDGIDKALALFTYARYVIHGKDTDTPFDIVKKNYKDGKNLSFTEKKHLYTTARQEAFRILNFHNKLVNQPIKLTKIN